MPAPDFKMLIKFQIAELSENFLPAVKTPREANRGELILIARNASGQTDTSGTLTKPLVTGENEWAYIPLSHGQVCHHLAKQLHENNTTSKEMPSPTGLIRHWVRISGVRDTFNTSLAALGQLGCGQTHSRQN